MENKQNSQQSKARFGVGLKQAKKLIAFGVVVLLVFGCAIPEDERCAGEYEWDPTFQLCLKMETAEEDTSPQPNGVGTPCTADTDCTALGQAVDFCILDPFAAQASGVCSVQDCVPEDCTGPHICCDCTFIESEWVRTDVPFCVPTSRQSLIENTLGCSCE